jgi:hypothetical protein
VFSASRGSPTDRLDTRHEPHQPTLYLSEKPDRARLPSRTAGGWRDLMDLDRPTGRGTDACLAGRRRQPGSPHHAGACAGTRSPSAGQNWFGSGSFFGPRGSKCRIRVN